MKSLLINKQNIKLAILPPWRKGRPKFTSICLGIFQNISIWC
jgi:hypothetical protein